MTTERPTHCFPCQASGLQTIDIPTNARPDESPQPKVYCAAVPIVGLMPQRVGRPGQGVADEHQTGL